MPRSCNKSSTFRSESGKRMYSITARRMISGLVLKYLKEAGLVMGKSYASALPASSQVLLTRPWERVSAWRTKVPFEFIQSEFSADCLLSLACAPSQKTSALSISGLRKGIHPSSSKEQPYKDGRNKARFGKTINRTTSRIEQKINGKADV